MGASGKVEVRVVISEMGRVIEANAIRHVALRNAAVDAARQSISRRCAMGFQ